MTHLFKKLTVVGFLAVTSTAMATNNQLMLENKAFILIDYDTGAVLAQKNANQPLPPASLTKMMTSYIIEQQLLSGKLKESDPVKMTEQAWCRGSSVESCMYVPLNANASVIDMLKGIIIQSGNDAAKAMAEHLAGSEQNFAKMMNEEAKKLGMNDTHFVNATGLHDDKHLSSAHDMAKLSQAVIQHSGKYYPIYKQKEFTYNNIKQGNRNALLYTDNTVDGLKTGHTQKAGYCLASSSKRGDMRLIAVVLGTKDAQARADQSRQLLNWGFDNFTTKVLAPNAQDNGVVTVKYGKADNVKVVTASALKVLTAKSDQDKIETKIELPAEVKAPLTQGQEIGKVVAMLNGKAVASVPLVTQTAVEQAGFFKRAWQFITGLF